MERRASRAVLAGEWQYDVGHPKPSVILRPLYQSRAHRVHPHILQLQIQMFFTPQEPIERFTLPDSSPAPKNFVDSMCRTAFDPLHDLGQNHQVKRGKNEVDVIRHNNQAIQIEKLTMSVHAGIDHDSSDGFRNNPVLMSAEGDKESSAGGSDVWKLAPVVIRILHADRLVLAATDWCMVQLFFCRRVSNREGERPGRRRQKPRGTRVAPTLACCISSALPAACHAAAQSLCDC